MRIVTYNVEWFDNLFDDAGRPQADGRWSARHNITREMQLEALGIVFTALDADAVMVIEAPDTNSRRDTRRALEQFADWAGLRAVAVEMGFVNDTQQEIALLYDPLVLSARHDPMGAPEGLGTGLEPPMFNSVYRLDLDTDRQREEVRFSKPPLELAVTHLATGFAFRMIGAHLKSKAPHGARRHDDVIRISIENRRKQLAQAIWLRERVEGHLAAGEPMIVLGDFNDGPGLDTYEGLFGRSALEIVMGRDGPEVPPEMRLHDPNAAEALSRRGNLGPTSARFYIDKERRYLAALLDYVMLSQELAAGAAWRIWHPFDDPVCYETPELHQALLTASDHFPVSVDVDLPPWG
ncbi:endonuclease/exonuclease/phosphatase family protein [Celeribacter indicus]|uniref:Endonuclease/exonuclease/phosphatase n=1 Tax=Celeribacter indicus TaxID=1208324 RepID=A0A0B5DXB3_9RHOB|nr:endonuclease/exonuclease/phosphatase family protein [Celeribacter indicus]AJE48078.1 endonuclease/exonuclease/phosphatase [Celeribacter indicus]SDW32049.1 Endonuclease/Exonuclease/phosphatase family protein [Celeribacter indicus]